jgi:hypothetical protein
MSWRRRWVVLVPGEVAWVEKQTREILEEVGDGSAIHFTIIPGRGRYQAVVEDGFHESSPEVLLAAHFSLEREEPVYAIEGVAEFPNIFRFLKGGEEETGDLEPEDLVRSLGCELPWMQEPPRKPHKKPTRTAALIQGLSAARVRKTLEEQEVPMPPGAYHLEESPQGLLVKEISGVLSFALSRLAYRFPLATVYSVTATPNLDFFVVYVSNDRKTVKFVPPPKEASNLPALHEVMGERTPERILAALGIPKEWFQP